MIHLLYMLFPVFTIQCQMDKAGKTGKKHSKVRILIEKYNRNAFLTPEMHRKLSRKREKAKAAEQLSAAFGE